MFAIALTFATVNHTFGNRYRLLVLTALAFAVIC